MTRRAIRPLLALCLALTLCLRAIPKASAAFSDVPVSHWAYTEILNAEARGLIQGSGGKFRPGDAVSKQAFLSMVCRAAGLDDRALETGAARFEPAMAFGRYFGWFEEAEMADKTAPITREMAAQLLVNALFPEELNGNGIASFRDEETASPARMSHIRAADRLGLMGGYADGTFRPQGQLTRAAAAAILHRALALKERTPVSGSSVQVPILMYHDVSYLGEGYSKTPEIFLAQMQELKDAGFETVFFSQVIDYVEKGSPLPAKPIVVSIDDGYATNHTYVLPILQELNMKAEISLIGDAIQYAKWGMNWDQVREMRDTGLVSFQAHTKNLHNDDSANGGRLGVLKILSESWEDYVRILGDDTKAILNLIKKETGIRPQVFTYPRGKHSPMAEAVSARLGCKVSVTTRDGVAVVTQGAPSSLRLMDRIGMDFLNGSVVAVLKQYGYQG